ncbi:MAG: DUF177 domain-containing protein [Flavipsychrobacter sp.]|nr:DUF177 domain-containing protein [Flavipsychrobacter sp.]
MKHNREYEIAWLGLKPGIHTFQYELDDRFMNDLGQWPFDGLNAQVTVTFDKQPSFFMLKFDVGGTVNMPCDRCGDEFKLRLWDEFNLLIKLTGEDTDHKDDDADVVFIPRSETVIDISNWLYEFIHLSIPLQRVHPDNADGVSGCNPKALELLNKLEVHEDDHKTNDIWKGLEALKEKEKSNRKSK